MSYEKKLLDDAVNLVQGKIDRYTNNLDALSDRLKEVEQKSAGGYSGFSGHSMQPSSKLADSIFQHEQFKAFKSGNQRKIKMTFDQPLLNVKNTITGDTGSPAEPSDILAPATRMPGIVGGAFRSLRLRDLLPVMPCSSNLVEVTRELAWTNNAASQASEGAQKAESDLTFELLSVPVRTIAHFIKVSRQAMDDQPALSRFIEQRMRHGVELEEEDQLLNGDGSDATVEGLIDQATAYNLGVSGDTAADTLSRAAEQVELQDWTPSGIVMNYADWRALTRVKDGEDRYLLAGAQGAVMPQVWGLPVVPTNSIASGSFLVADFAMAAILWDRQQTIVEMSEADGTNFQDNLITVRAESRIALTVIRPSAIVAGTF